MQSINRWTVMKTSALWHSHDSNYSLNLRHFFRYLMRDCNRWPALLLLLLLKTVGGRGRRGGRRNHSFIRIAASFETSSKESWGFFGDFSSSSSSLLPPPSTASHLLYHPVGILEMLEGSLLGVTVHYEGQHPSSGTCLHKADEACNDCHSISITEKSNRSIV